MIDVTSLQLIDIYLYDPTRTTTLRNAFSMNMRRRFNELIKVVKIAVDERDVFGLRAPTIFQMNPPLSRAFNFPRSKDKVAAFMKWLDEQVRLGILQISIFDPGGTTSESAWLNTYITDSYKRGLIRARMELLKAKYDVPTIEETGGVELLMSTFINADTLGLLYSRTFSELKGITDAMDQVISRILTQGFVDGDGPALLARKLVAAINGEGLGDLGLTDSLGRYISPINRAEMLARTELIRAHHLAMINEYRQWAVLGVKVMAEFVTAGDNRVCPICEGLAHGSPYSLNEIQDMIPAHPSCRCVAIPYIQGESTLINGG